MEQNNNDYHISFFKPTTERARFNRNIVILLVCIWVVAIFGFQVLLRIMQKPTPEEAYIQYENIWDNVKNGEASENDYQVLAKTSLSVLGKIFIDTKDKPALNNTLNWSVYNLADSAQKEMILTDVMNFEKIKSEIVLISDEKYVAAKNDLIQKVSPLLGLEMNDVRSKILPVELVSSQMKEFNEANIQLLPQIMSKYLIHNQSVLTNTKFLGFPFHYFYTAVFLLILFVFLCWLYCVRADRRNRILNIQE